MADPLPDRVQTALLYHFCRLRLPALALSQEAFQRHLERAFAEVRRKTPESSPPVTWPTFVENLHALDFFLASACVQGLRPAWEMLFGWRASRTEALLVDSLRRHAARLYPRDEQRQEEAVCEFWGFLLAGEREGALPVLARYDGQRPLAPWLILVFQNHHLSDLRKTRKESPPTGDPEPHLTPHPSRPDAEGDSRWHEVFREASREWLAELKEENVLLLGLLVRYRVTQREAARILGINEGNVTRRLNKINTEYHEHIGRVLWNAGWTGDDLNGFIRKEMLAVLLDEPALAADRLAALSARLGKKVPVESSAH